MKPFFIIAMALLMGGACSAGKTGSEDSAATDTASVGEGAATVSGSPAVFSADSAYAYVERLMDYGPRVPNTAAHRQAGDWLTATLRGFGWDVTEQQAVLTAFDGTALQARNIFARINPDADDRLLLLAHWDSRPWADQDPDPSKRAEPVLGANDGGSGVGVLLEIARQLKLQGSRKGVDILLVDAEDWGTDNQEDSWALGTRYFVENPPVDGYRPKEAILLDMVGSPDARFGVEYFSLQSNPDLLRRVLDTASRLGHGNYFVNEFGGAVTDDHVELIKHGIPAIDIIDYRYSDQYQGFDPTWHTTHDDMSNISPATLRAVGETIITIASGENKQ